MIVHTGILPYQYTYSTIELPVLRTVSRGIVLSNFPGVD